MQVSFRNYFLFQFIYLFQINRQSENLSKTYSEFIRKGKLKAFSECVVADSVQKGTQMLMQVSLLPIF